MLNFLSKVSLSSWDEAWYGVISKNILKSGDFIKLVFNGEPYFDHPPFALWLQAISMKLFGISEFSVRFPSFLLGIGTLIILFLLGKQLFSKTAGLFAVLSLLIAPWFLTRSLSGNLDITLTFLFVLSYYLAIKASQSSKFLIPLSCSLAFLLLTKSLVPFTIFPAIIYILWKKVKIRELIIPIIIFILITAPWFVINLINNPTLLQKYISIGYPGTKTHTNIWQNIILTKTYLHNGIGNIFLYGLFSLLIGGLLFKKKYIPMTIFISTFLLPFAFSNKGHIWHLIPLYPFWILAFYGIINIFVKKYRFAVMLIVFLLISWNQIKRNWYETINVPAFTSDFEILATKSKEYDYPLVLDDDAVPEVLFYSDKDHVERTGTRSDLRTRFDSKNNFLLITRDWRLIEEKINKEEYILIAKDRDKVLILKN